MKKSEFIRNNSKIKRKLLHLQGFWIFVILSGLSLREQELTLQELDTVEISGFCIVNVSSQFVIENCPQLLPASIIQT